MNVYIPLECYSSLKRVLFIQKEVVIVQTENKNVDSILCRIYEYMHK